MALPGFEAAVGVGAHHPVEILFLGTQPVRLFQGVDGIACSWALELKAPCFEGGALQSKLEKVEALCSARRGHGFAWAEAGGHKEERFDFWTEAQDLFRHVDVAGMDGIKAAAKKCGWFAKVQHGLAKVHPRRRKRKRQGAPAPIGVLIR